MSVHNTANMSAAALRRIMGQSFDHGKFEQGRVIFRTEHDKYAGTENFLAVFPNTPANPGRLAYIAFRLFEDGEAVFEPPGEMDLGYYYGKTRIVRKDTETALRCLDAIKARYAGDYRVMEKMTK